MGLSYCFEPPNNGIHELTIVFKSMKLRYFIIIVGTSNLMLTGSTSIVDIERSTSPNLLSHTTITM